MVVLEGAPVPVTEEANLPVEHTTYVLVHTIIDRKKPALLCQKVSQWGADQELILPSIVHGEMKSTVVAAARRIIPLIDGRFHSPIIFLGKSEHVGYGASYKVHIDRSDFYTTFVPFSFLVKDSMYILQSKGEIVALPTTRFRPILKQAAIKCFQFGYYEDEVVVPFSTLEFQSPLPQLREAYEKYLKKNP